MTLINYNNTLDIRRNIDLFMTNNYELIKSLHTQQFDDESINQLSNKQYTVLLHQAALEYSVNLWFFILANTENETLEASELEYKELYKYKDIQFNLAHYNVDLNNIFETVKINHTPQYNDIIINNNTYYEYATTGNNNDNEAIGINFNFKVNSIDSTNKVSLFNYNYNTSTLYGISMYISNGYLYLLYNYFYTRFDIAAIKADLGIDILNDDIEFKAFIRYSTTVDYYFDKSGSIYTVDYGGNESPYFTTYKDTNSFIINDIELSFDYISTSHVIDLAKQYYIENEYEEVEDGSDLIPPPPGGGSGYTGYNTAPIDYYYNNSNNSISKLGVSTLLLYNSNYYYLNIDKLEIYRYTGTEFKAGSFNLNKLLIRLVPESVSDFTTVESNTLSGDSDTYVKFLLDNSDIININRDRINGLIPTIKTL